MQVRPGLRPVMLCQGVTLTRHLLLVSVLRGVAGGRCLRSELATDRRRPVRQALHIQRVPQDAQQQRL